MLEKVSVKPKVKEEPEEGVSWKMTWEATRDVLKVGSNAIFATYNNPLHIIYFL